MPSPTTQVSFATAGDQFSDGEIHSLRQRCARTKATRTKANPQPHLPPNLAAALFPEYAVAADHFSFSTLLLSLAFHPWHCPSWLSGGQLRIWVKHKSHCTVSILCFVLLTFVEQGNKDKGILYSGNIVKERLESANMTVSWHKLGTNFITTTPNGMRQGKKITLDLPRAVSQQNQQAQDPLTLSHWVSQTLSLLLSHTGLSFDRGPISVLWLLLWPQPFSVSWWHTCAWLRRWWLEKEVTWRPLYPAPVSDSVWDKKKRWLQVWRVCQKEVVSDWQ